MDDNELYTVAYIRYAVAHVATKRGKKRHNWKFAIEWHRYPRDNKQYDISCIQDDVLAWFFLHAEMSTIRPDGQYPSGWRIYPDQSYIDSCLIDALKNDITAHQERLASLGTDASQDDLAAVYSEREELDPDRIRAWLEMRSDFQMLGTVDREFDHWRQRPLGKCMRGPAPKPVEARKIDISELRERLAEILEQTDPAVDDTETFDDTGDDQRPAMSTAEDGFPEHLTRIQFTHSVPRYKVLLNALGARRMHRASRLWRHRNSSGSWDCPICQDVQGAQLATECGHFFCEQCIQAHLSVAPDANCPYCRTKLGICPFPATALADPCRLVRGDRRALDAVEAAHATQKKKAKQAAKTERRRRRALEQGLEANTKRGGKVHKRRKEAKKR